MNIGEKYDVHGYGRIECLGPNKYVVEWQDFKGFHVENPRLVMLGELLLLGRTWDYMDKKKARIRKRFHDAMRDYWGATNPVQDKVEEVVQ